MALPAGSLDRTVAAITIGVHQGASRHDLIAADSRQGEYEQQVQVPVSGKALGWAFVDTVVVWEWPFLYAPLQRRVPFLTPHFTYGIDMQTASDLVIVTAHIEAWTISEEAWYTGATVRLASTAPLATTALVPFTAMAHLSFVGYASYPEGAEFQ